MGKLILVLGGARSGKSAFAERLARDLGGARVVFVATAQAGDDEMAQRIAQHRRTRPAGWRTVEAPRAVGAALRQAVEVDHQPVAVIDCLTLLASNVLGPDPDRISAAAAREELERELDGLLAACRELPTTVIVVSNEVGAGIVPATPVGRLYRDLLGWANQALAREAQEAHLLVAGIPLRIKPQTTGGDKGGMP